MDHALPQTGTAALLEQLSDFVPDDFINTLFRQGRRRGRRKLFSPAQLYRTLLLALLTPVNSFNLLAQLLPEQSAWRGFARLRNSYQLPDAKMLHGFRQACGVRGLRTINRHLLSALLPPHAPSQKTVALMDSTDLPASTSAFKKNSPAITRRTVRLWEDGRSRRVRPGGLSVIRSTPFGSGSVGTTSEFS